MNTTLSCVLGPRLYALHTGSWKLYDSNFFEQWADFLVMTFSALWITGLIILLIIAGIMYGCSKDKKKTTKNLLRWLVIIFLFFTTALVIRTTSRMLSPEYTEFLEILKKARKSYDLESQGEIRHYDFEFSAWPIDYEVKMENTLGGNPRISLKNDLEEAEKTFLLSWPQRFRSYVLVKTVAVGFMYPGSIFWVKMKMKNLLITGRMNLVKGGGYRSKLITYTEQNTVDTMFIDQRGMRNKGTILVISCDGNLGFYETGGTMMRFLAEGYSVLGWNHPGFDASTGTPFPEQEIDAIDAVVKYAVEKLEFSIDRILLNGWSIGGFTATWAAMNYQGLHGLILDATFDDFLPLAMNRMPSALGGITQSIVKGYFNLHVAEQLKRYNGSVLLVRRTNDEIMCTPAGNLAHNRANYLLIELLEHRYPKLFEGNSTESLDVLKSYLSRPTHDSSGKTIRNLSARTQGLFPDGVTINEDICSAKITQDIERNNGEVKYPSTLGADLDRITKQHLVVYLASKYMEDQASGHNALLDREHLHPFWKPKT